MSRLQAVWAQNEEGVIGDGKTLLWHVPEDLRHFSALTRGNTVYMGTKTFLSLPNGALPKRRNVILTRKGFTVPEYLQNENIEVWVNPSEKLAEQTEGFIIGGGEIYAAYLPLVHTVHVTVVRYPVTEGEIVKAPTLSDFVLTDETALMESSVERIGYRFQTWERKV